MKLTSKFFDMVRTELFGGTLSQTQVDGIQTIVDAWPESTDFRWIAYALATAYHETDKTMQPIAEYGKGHGKGYGVPMGPFSQIYYGRGFVQLTWFTNYRKAEERIPGSDLVAKPDNALEPGIAAQVIVRGMTEGWFTGAKLMDFFNTTKTDWINARRIINGLDKAAMIGGYALHFMRALEGHS